MSFYVKKCLSCGAENHPSEIACLRCDKDLPEAKTESDREPLTRPKPVSRPTPVKQPETIRLQPTEVVVTDIDMKFASMVGFMVKWAIATIPALIILLFVGVLALAILMSFGSIGSNFKTPADEAHKLSP